MKYTITNKAFDAIQQKYGTIDLDPRDETELRDICDMLNVPLGLREITVESRTGGPAKTRKIFDKGETIKNLKKYFSFSEYMGVEYWREEQYSIESEYFIFDKLRENKGGGDTFSLYAEAKLGFYNLAPGQRVTVNWTPEWVEVFKAKPAAQYLEIVDENDEKYEYIRPINAVVGEMDATKLKDLIEFFNIPVERGVSVNTMRIEIITEVKDKYTASDFLRFLENEFGEKWDKQTAKVEKTVTKKVEDIEGKGPDGQVINKKYLDGLGRNEIIALATTYGFEPEKGRTVSNTGSGKLIQFILQCVAEK